MKNMGKFLQSKMGIVLFALGFSVALATLSTGGVVVDTEDTSTQQPQTSSPKNYAEEAGAGSESYNVIPPLQNSSQFYPAYPGNAGSVMPTPPTYVDPNAGQQNLPMAPTGQTPYGSPAPSSGSGGMMGSPTAGGNIGGMPGNPIESGNSTGSGSMMPSAPTPGQNLNELGIADPKYGRFEAARLEAAVMPHQATRMNAARNQVMRGGKPFSGYKQPSPYSPYMSLMRTEDTIRGINNYYEYVMPQIEQQQRNLQVSQEIHGLQSTARSGYEALQDMKQRPGNAPVQAGAKAPATFMNTGGYYGTGR